MSFLRTHGAATSVGHLIGAGLVVANMSPEKWLSTRLTPAIDSLTGLVGLGGSIDAITPFPVPGEFEPWQMLFVTMGLFLLLTIPSGTQKDEVFGDAGLDENLEASRTEFALMRYEVAAGYVAGYVLASQFELLGLVAFPASAVGIPIAFFLLYLVATIAAAWVAAGFAYLGICPRVRVNRIPNPRLLPLASLDPPRVRRLQPLKASTFESRFFAAGTHCRRGLWEASGCEVAGARAPAQFGHVLRAALNAATGQGR
jgi:hypothetical protein